MKAYIGSKIILAEPEPAGIPSKSGDPAQGTPGYKVVYPDGYVSWSPKDVFEEAYREVSIGETELVADG